MLEHLYYYRVTRLVDVFDGDTIRVGVSLGRKLKDEWPCRLSRVNTPELRDADPVKKERAYAARDYLRGRLESAMVAGEPVVIHSVKLEKYGRCLCELYVGNTNINDELLALGLAEAYAD